VRERPVDRELADLTIVLVDVCAATVLEVAADRVVVVAVDGGDLPSFDELADVIWWGPYPTRSPPQ
jgi:hypothetical protein